MSLPSIKLNTSLGIQLYLLTNFSHEYQLNQLKLVTLPWLTEFPNKNLRQIGQGVGNL